MSKQTSRPAATSASLMPPADNRWAGALLMALFAHALLVAALTWGIGWQKNTTPAVAQAELWARMPQSAAPRLVDEGPVATGESTPENTEATPPAPAARPEPAPLPRPEPQPAQPPVKAQADIALQQQREREQAKRQQQEQEARQKAENEAKEAKRRREEQQAAEQAKAAERDKREKAERERLAADKAAKDKADQASKRAQEKAEKAQQAQAAKDRAENVKRMMGLAGASGDASSTGTAKQSSGPNVGASNGAPPSGLSAGYAGRIVSAVRPNIVFTDALSGNPTAEVEVRTLPDGTVASRRIVKSSGIPSWDDAVLKALDRTVRLPRDENGRVPGTLTIAFRPKE